MTAMASVTTDITPIAAIKMTLTRVMSAPDDRRWRTSPTPTLDKPEARMYTIEAIVKYCKRYQSVLSVARDCGTHLRSNQRIVMRL